MTIGERIKNRREELGLTQDELAKKVGYKSRSSINKIELSRELPLKKIEQIARALDTSPSYLMGWVERPDQTDETIEIIRKQVHFTQIEESTLRERLGESVSNSDEFSKYESTEEEIREALHIYALYKNATREVQQAVEMILKSAKRDSESPD